MVVPVPAVDHDVLSTIEYWSFRVGLLIVFLAWIAEHVAEHLRRAWEKIRSGSG